MGGLMNTNGRNFAKEGKGSKEQLHIATQLDAEGRRLLASMPVGVRLTELTAKHPRIINQMARLWAQSDKMSQYFDEILLDGRGIRSGFSEVVVIELMALRDHYLKISPNKDGVWDAAPGVDRGR